MSQSNEKKKQLLHLVINGTAQEVKKFFEENPNFDVNEELDEVGGTALHIACQNDSHEIVKMLLSHPDINVNQGTKDGITPLHRSAESHIHTEVFKILLKDPRVEVNRADAYGRTTLWWLCTSGILTSIKWMIASGKWLDLEKKGMEFGPRKKYLTPLEIAKRSNSTNAVELLERFMSNPEKTRIEVRKELGVDKSDAAETFATVVFLCDAFYSLNVNGEQEEPESERKARRFFAIAMKIPMELQMKTANTTQGIREDLIPSNARETAFRKLAKDM